MNCIRITKHHIVRYDFNQDKEVKTEAQLENEKNLRDNAINGTLSKKARQRLLNAIHNILGALETGGKGNGKLYKSRQHLPTFVTLTLSAKQMHTDEEIKRNMLNRFIVTLQRNEYCAGYVWKAEKQKNGNIHFHLLLTNYVPYTYIRQVWNSIQNDNGYIEEYRRVQREKHKNGFFFDSKMAQWWPRNKQYEAYSYGISNNWTDPNSTDIHSLRKVRKAASYIAKYMGKKELDKNEKVEGRLWGRSDNIEECKTPQSEVTQAIADELIQLQDEELVETIDNEYCTIYRFKHNSLLDFQKTELYRIYKEQHENNFLTIFKPPTRTVII